LNAIKTLYIRQNGLLPELCGANAGTTAQQVHHHQDPDRVAGFGMISLPAREAASSRPAFYARDLLLINVDPL